MKGSLGRHPEELNILLLSPREESKSRRGPRLSLLPPPLVPFSRVPAFLTLHVKVRGLVLRMAATIWIKKEEEEEIADYASQCNAG